MTSTTVTPGRTKAASEAPADPSATRQRRQSRRRRPLWRNWQLYSLLVLPVIWFVVFRYVPMAGNIIAFRNYVPGGNIFGEGWVGLDNFTMFLSDPSFWQV
ncbi:MAG: sugar ABC transporter permease, partial [Humibacter sp.]